MARDPAALQLRLLQTVVEVAGEKNSTLVMPVPVELLRFFEKMAPGPSPRAAEIPEDLGDAEVEQAEAAISSTNVPPLTESDLPAVPSASSANELAAADAVSAAGEPSEAAPQAREAKEAGAPAVEEPNSATSATGPERAARTRKPRTGTS
jgi:hypothetical protein